MDELDRAQLLDRELPQLIRDAIASAEIADALADPDLGLTADDLFALARERSAELAAVGGDQLLDQYLADPGPPEDDDVPGPAPYGPVRGWSLAAIVVVVVVAAIYGVDQLWSTTWWVDVLLIIGALLIGLTVIGIALVTLTPTADESTGDGRTAAGRRSARANREQLLERWRGEVRGNGVLPFLRSVINDRAAPLNWFTMKITQAPGLDHVRQASLVVDTSSALRFRQAVAGMRTGALGIAGSRGVGKTTLLETHLAGQRQSIAVLVPAPVRYEARDFVLHLYATLCRAALDRFDPRPTAARRRPARYRGVRRLGTALGALAAFVLGWLVLVFALGRPIGSAADLTASIRALPAPGLAVWPTLALWLAGLVALGATAGAVLLDRRQERTGAAAFPVRETQRRLARIRFLQTTTTGWSGKLTTPASELAVTGSAQRAEQPLTYPEIVAELREYLGLLVSWLPPDTRVVVAIDELDKIETAEDAQVFVNEIKGVFGVDRTQFVLSVSEDALAAFERRGLPVRDAFDSAFDEVVWIDALNLRDSCALLRKRVIGLSDLFCALAHCMAGGLARDLIRIARLMRSLAGDERTGIDLVCVRLVGEDLRRKVRAFQVATGALAGAPDTPAFIRTLRGLTEDPDRLLDALPGLLATGGDAELRTLRWQAAVYVYHCATLLQVFTEDLSKDRLDGRHRALDELARAKQALTTHPQLAWQQLDEFRDSWQLRPVALPSD